MWVCRRKEPRPSPGIQLGPWADDGKWRCWMCVASVVSQWVGMPLRPPSLSEPQVLVCNKGVSTLTWQVVEKLPEEIGGSQGWGPG